MPEAPSPEGNLDFGTRYDPLRELGSGGLGRVFLVRDRYLEKDLALKLLQRVPKEEADLLEFQREFALLSEIEHPGISRAYDFGYLGGRPYFTMEFVPGEPLGSRSEAWRLEDFLATARSIAEALAFLHRGGILHLDLKTSNIIVRSTQEEGRPVLIDFGLFRRAGTSRPGRRIAGSLPTMAPEFFRGGAIGAHTDVYALGATLYRVIAGRHPRLPFREPLSKEIDDPGEWDPAPPPPSRFAAWVPPDLDNIILRSLAVEPSSRFPNAGEFLLALERMGETGRRPATSASTPIAVGRQDEMRRIDAFLRQFAPRDARARGAARSRVLVLTGPQGMGQSHLLREGKVRSQTLGIHYCLETGYLGRSGPPSLLFRFLALHMDPNAREGRARWLAFLSRLEHPRRPYPEDSSDRERQLRRAGEIALAADSVREPVILAVDGLQHFDEVSVSLVLDLARFLGERTQGAGPPISLVLGYREEGPVVAVLRELTRYLLDGRRGEVITLRPLEVPETLELYRHHANAKTEEAHGFSIHASTGGCPARIVGLARSAADPQSPVLPKPGDRLGETLGAGIDDDTRSLVLILAALERPAFLSEIVAMLRASRFGPRSGPRSVARRLPARVARTPSPTRVRLPRMLAECERRGLVAVAEGTGRRRAWIATPAARSILEVGQVSERARLHHAIAGELARRARGSADPRLLEAVHHFRLAGSKAELVRFGLPVARHLKTTLRNRAALEIYRAVLEALPAARRSEGLRTVLELAELPARIGDLDEGIRILQGFLQEKGLNPTARARVLLRLATLYSRRGDFPRAGALFEEGFGRPTIALGLEERLYFLNEHAAMKAVVGDHAGAADLCARGLALTAKQRRPRLREIALSLHATRANVALRSFDYEASAREYEEALQIAESVGSPAHQAGILNNLGIVYSNCDRYQDAIRAYRDAETMSLGVDEGPSLISIYSNLAILHAKTGDAAASEKALAEADRLGPLATGRRQELFLRHARGLSLLSRGRFAAARAELEGAIEIGRSTGDRFIAAFDELYRAEALLLEGAYAEAETELERIAGPGGPPTLRKIALARLVLLYELLAWRGRADSTWARYEATAVDRPVAYLEAWDRLYLGWASSIAASSTDRGKDAARERARRFERADELLDLAGRFFRAHGLRPAAAWNAWIRAESRFLRGDFDGALETLRSEGAAGSEIAAVLGPLLEARLLLETREGLDRAGDLLAEAGAALVGNPLREWAARLQALRAAVGRSAGRPRPGSDRACPVDPTIDGPVDSRLESARGLPEEVQRDYLESGYWKAWAVPGVIEGGGAETHIAKRKKTRARDAARTRGAAGGRAGSDSSGEETPRITPTTRLTSDAGRFSRRGLVARSEPMRRLIATLDRVSASELPILVQGETGTGKELLARIVHHESRRASGPFVVLDCATLPTGLLETEVFGAKAGAFTDLNEDRSGLLSTAAGGTILVDEVGGMPLDLQAKLLRVLGAGSFRRVGDDREMRAECRFIFSTARDLEGEVKAGRFRGDLLHRMGVLSLRVPPLRDRMEDLPHLVALFLSEGTGLPPRVDRGVLEALAERPWPGNVRELRNLILRLRLECPETIGVEALRRASVENPQASAFAGGLLEGHTLLALQDRLERDYLLHHLERLDGDTTALSGLLGVSRQQLYRRCRRLGIRLRGSGGDRP